MMSMVPSPFSTPSLYAAGSFLPTGSSLSGPIFSFISIGGGAFLPSISRAVTVHVPWMFLASSLPGWARTGTRNGRNRAATVSGRTRRMTTSGSGFLTFEVQDGVAVLGGELLGPLDSRDGPQADFQLVALQLIEALDRLPLLHALGRHDVEGALALDH